MDRFKEIQPFPHIIVENYFPTDWLNAVLTRFPPPEDLDFWSWQSNDENSKKLMCQDKNKIAKNYPINYKKV